MEEETNPEARRDLAGFAETEMELGCQDRKPVGGVAELGESGLEVLQASRSVSHRRRERKSGSGHLAAQHALDLRLGFDCKAKESGEALKTARADAPSEKSTPRMISQTHIPLSAPIVLCISCRLNPLRRFSVSMVRTQRHARTHSRSPTFSASCASLITLPSFPPRFLIFWKRIGRRNAGTAEARMIVCNGKALAPAPTLEASQVLTWAFGFFQALQSLASICDERQSARPPGTSPSQRTLFFAIPALHVYPSCSCTCVRHLATISAPIDNATSAHVRSSSSCSSFSSVSSTSLVPAARLLSPTSSPSFFSSATTSPLTGMTFPTFSHSTVTPISRGLGSGVSRVAESGRVARNG